MQSVKVSRNKPMGRENESAAVGKIKALYLFFTGLSAKKNILLGSA